MYGNMYLGVCIWVYKHDVLRSSGGYIMTAEHNHTRVEGWHGALCMSITRYCTQLCGVLCYTMYTLATHVATYSVAPLLIQWWVGEGNVGINQYSRSGK